MSSYELRNLGAKHVFLKTGEYRPADLARAVKYASKARIDLLTVDGGDNHGYNGCRVSLFLGLKCAIK